MTNHPLNRGADFFLVNNCLTTLASLRHSFVSDHITVADFCGYLDETNPRGMLPAVVVRCSQLLSFASLEPALIVAVDACGFDKERLVVRGRLADVESSEDLTLADEFLRQLADAAGEEDGEEVARRLLEHVPGEYDFGCGPRRSLVGWVDDGTFGRKFDVALSRDKAHEGAMAIYVTQENEKIGYVLARLEDENILVLRGAFVAPKARGTGLASILLSTYVALAERLNCEAKTELIDKPVLALSLLSFGFEPLNTKYAVWVSLRPQGACVLWSDDHDNLGSLYSKSFCSKQKIELLTGHEREGLSYSDARKIYVKTAFAYRPKKAPSSTKFNHHFYAARLAAFLSDLSL